MKLAAVGDVMLGDHPVCIGHGVDSTIQKHGFAFLLDECAEVLKDADLLFGNLESPLSSHGLRPGVLSSMELRGRPEYADALARAGFAVLNVANNHAMQHGSEAFAETVLNLRNAGVQVAGLAEGSRSNEVWLRLHGEELVLVSYSLRPEKFCKTKPPYAKARYEEILDHIDDLRARTDSAIVLSLHWGEEYLNYPHIDQIEFARRAIDRGVRILLGHHPHVLQGFEEYNGGLIAYSLGNFIFDKWQLNPRETAILQIDIEGGCIKNWNLVPILINRKFQPVPVKGPLAQNLERKIDAYNAALSPRAHSTVMLTKAEYMSLAQAEYFRFRMQSYAYFLAHIHKYSPRLIAASMIRSLRRRFEGLFGNA